jgi:RNA polymerase sigma-70 factor, ECF subfamily
MMLDDAHAWWRVVPVDRIPWSGTRVFLFPQTSRITGVLRALRGDNRRGEGEGPLKSHDQREIMNITMVSTNHRTSSNTGTDAGAGVELARVGVVRLSPIPLARQQIVRRIAMAGASPLEALYDVFVRQCFSLARRMLDQPSVAEQATREAFVKLWACPVVRPDSYPASYSTQEGWFQSCLLSVTHNKCLAELRLLRLRHPEVSLEAMEQSVTGNLADIMVDAALSAADRRLQKVGQRPLQQVVGQFASSQRQVLELAYFRGLSQVEIAVELRQPLGTVKSHTRMALPKLQAMII